MAILRMIEQGKLSAEEGARLLAALNRPAPPPVDPFDTARTLQIRVRAVGSDRLKQQVTLPVGLARLALAWLPPAVRREWAQVDAALAGGRAGLLVEVVDHEQGVQVEVRLA